MDAMKILDLIFPFSAEKYYRLLDERKVHEEGTIVRFRRRELIVFRHEGRYFVYRNVCPHRSKSLRGGMMDEKWLSCPHHNWHFDRETGTAEINPEFSVTVVPSKSEGGYVWIRPENL
jgi:nitrite reductase (NADH) small subunit